MDFDAVVLGTGLSESIAAAALSKAGYKVAHIDNNQYYGGDEASLTLDELAEWADLRSAQSSEGPSSQSEYLTRQRRQYTSISRSQTLPSHSRQYAVSLAPSIVPSIGPHIESLIASGVSRYGQFKLLEKVAVYDRPGYVQSVPGSKEDVFKSKELSLVDKRRLMRFLLFAAGEFEGKKELEGKEEMPFLRYLKEVFSLNHKAATAIAYALAFCVSAEEPTLPVLQRIRQFLRSAGRYGSSPFLVGHYGGLGETAQGFCRTSAVKGGTYILGRAVVSVQPPTPTADVAPNDEKTSSASGHEHSRYRVELEDFSEQLTGRIVVSSSDYIPASSSEDNASTSTSVVARGIAIIDRPLVFTPSEAPEEPVPPEVDALSEDGGDGSSERPAAPKYDVDTALLVFPPGSLEKGSQTTAAHVLVTGEGSMSAPRGKYILNISLPLSDAAPNSLSAEDLLQPYLEASLTLTVPPASAPETLPTAPLFALFYFHHTVPSPSSDVHAAQPGLLVTPPYTRHLPIIADAATQNAETIFWKAVQRLKAAGVRPAPLKENEKEDAEKSEEGGEQRTGDIDSLWPPLDAVEDESSDEW